MKNADAPAVRREAEVDWGKGRRRKHLAEADRYLAECGVYRRQRDLMERAIQKLAEVAESTCQFDHRVRRLKRG
jgi:hypothetical protein